ncbi:cytochrome P450 71A1-like [Panicum virgatum]|uniref:cytochrome P450 71A1-like n=1 Tax=Panicum virgatum TaxID=38727 RepID=UPI0019D56034|nr:cytochrome P450 71A1-like [Panicum virgatum]
MAKKLPGSTSSAPITHRSLHELYLRYGGGGGLLLLQLGRRRTLVVSTAAAAADLFGNHDLAFASRPRSVAADRLMYGCRNVSFAPYGEDWRRSKKAAVVHLLSPRRVASFAPVRAAEAAALVARARRAAEAREAVELRELLYGYTNAVVTRAATGAAGATVERLKQLIGSTAPLVAGLQPEDVLPDAPARFVRWATGLDKMLDDRAEAWYRFLSEILAAHQEKGAGSAGEEEDEDFLDVLLRLRRESADGLEFTGDRIKAMVKDMIAAGTGTSSETLQWTMAELVANPRVMAKLQDEIARVAGAAADEAAITEADLSKMEYLKAVFKEVLRLHPPSPLLVPHESTTPAVVRGYEIPARTVLFVNVWAIGRDPTAWDAPEEFRPERFVGGGPAADFRGTDYQFIPFGAGRRMCPGINFALPVVELALASLLRHFDWELSTGMCPADVDTSEAPGLTMPPRVPLVLVPRCKTLAQPAN